MEVSVKLPVTQSSSIDMEYVVPAAVGNTPPIATKRKQSQSSTSSDDLESPASKVSKVSVASSTTKGLPFSNMKIAITGVLEGVCNGSRDEVEDLILKYGGKVSKSISGVTTYLVAGAVLEDGRPSHESSKYRAAIEKKVSIQSFQSVYNNIFIPYVPTNYIYIYIYILFS